jgi:hypothetical protein
MALTRKLLKSLGVSDDAVEAIIDAHSETVTGLKERIATLEQQTEDFSVVTKERDELKEKVETLTTNGGDAAKVQAEFDAYKAEVEGEKARTAKRAALDALLRDKVGVKRDEARQLILEAAKLDEYELDDSGAIKDADGHVKTLGEKYSAFVGTTRTTGAKPITPPSGGGGQTKEEILKISDYGERIRAIAQNRDLF